MCNHPFREEIPPNIQPKPLLALLKAVLLSRRPARLSPLPRAQQAAGQARRVGRGTSRRALYARLEVLLVANFFFARVLTSLFRKCFIVIIMVNYQITFLKKSFSGAGGFLPAMKQIGNVAALPGIVHVSVCCKNLIFFCSYLPEIIAFQMETLS